MAHVNESCLKGMYIVKESLHMCKGVMTHLNGTYAKVSLRMWMSHVLKACTYMGCTVASLGFNEINVIIRVYMWINQVAYQWVMAHVNELWLIRNIYIWDTPWVVARVNEWCQMSHGTCEWVMSPEVCAYVGHHVSHSTCEWVVSNESWHLWVGHFTYEIFIHGAPQSYNGASSIHGSVA